jgi:hypothetical protein
VTVAAQFIPGVRLGAWSTAFLDPQGALGQFDVLSGTDAWLLAPGAGLWQTTDGITWRSIGGTP